MQKRIQTFNGGVKIDFSGDVKKQNIVLMVENCKTGRCECMSDATKAKIESMEVLGEDGEVSIKLSGEITTQEIKEAVARSKVIDEK